jgi:D-glycero-D-manno-heptose 1,7-bisphosphate phosphatase
MSKTAAIFLDRDGTLIEDSGHISHAGDVKFFDTAFEALRLVQQHFLLFIVTNQSGVGLGKIERSVAEAVNAYVLSRLSQSGITISRLYCCMHRRSDQCGCIKPNPYFLHCARDEFGVDLAHSFVIGDHPHDIEFARRGGAQGLYVLTGHGRRHEYELDENVRIFAGLKEAAEYICGSVAVSQC